ncbi:hypothetical protein ACE0DR_03000 [Azotobacter sp. CWF10]
MCACFLKPEAPPERQDRFYRASGAWIDGLIARYDVALHWVLRHQALTLLIAVATLGLTAAVSTRRCPRASSRSRTPG